MAYISFQPSEYFNTKIYTQSGGANNGATQTISLADVGLTWIKNRSYANSYCAFDTIRGGNGSECLMHLNTNAGAQGSDVDSAEGVTFGASSTTIGTDGGGYGYNNRDGDNYVAWSWRTGTTSGLSGGTITPTAYSINTTSGVGMYRYNGTSSAGTIAHGLGVAPECVLVKKISAADSWWMYHRNTHSDVTTSNQYYTVLDTTVARNTNNEAWNNTTPTDTLIHFGDAGNVNSSSGSSSYIMYAFASKKGFSKMGGYVGNSNADGTFVYTGFRPSMLITKKASGTAHWYQWDDKRIGYNPSNYILFPADNAVEDAGATERIDFLSNGFKFRHTDSDHNGSGQDYIYLAFAEFPLVSSNSKAGVAR